MDLPELFHGSTSTQNIDTEQLFYEYFGLALILSYDKYRSWFFAISYPVRNNIFLSPLLAVQKLNLHSC